MNYQFLTSAGCRTGTTLRSVPAATAIVSESSMKCLSIQVQPGLDSSREPRDVIELVRAIGRYPEVDEGKDDGRYINLNFFSEDLLRLWSELKSEVLEHPDLGDWLKKVSIVVCEGCHGWDDYLLLHHFDQSEAIDELPNH